MGLILPASGPGTVPHTWGVAMNTYDDHMEK